MAGEGTDSQDYEQDEDARQARDYRALAGAIGGALIVLLFACLLWWLLSQRAEVPDVTGMPRDRASSAIAKAGFKVGAVTSQTALPEEVGLVLDQTPDGGQRALKGSDIALVVATEFVAGGTPGSPDYVDWGMPDTGEAEIVLPPTGGDGVEAADVDYYVAPEDLGPQVPSVQSMTAAAARSALSAAGYGCLVKSGPSSTGLPVGLAYFQDSAPGEFKPRGTVVTVWIVEGGPSAGFELPE